METTLLQLVVCQQPETVGARANRSQREGAQEPAMARVSSLRASLITNNPSPSISKVSFQLMGEEFLAWLLVYKCVSYIKWSGSTLEIKNTLEEMVLDLSSL